MLNFEYGVLISAFGSLPHDLDAGEVGLPHLIDGCGFIAELVRSLDDNKGRTGNEVTCCEQTIDRCF